MKTIIHTLFFLLLNASIISAQDFSLVGTWQGTKDGETGKFIFDKKGYATIDQGGEKVGGKKYMADGVALKVMYDVNPTVEPKTIDFVISHAKDNLEITRMVGIYKFVNEKTLILNLNYSDQKRPKKFDPESPNQIALLRIK